MRASMSAAGVAAVAGGLFGVVGGGAALGQGLGQGPGVPYRVVTVDGGREEVSPQVWSFVPWGGRVAMSYRGTTGGTVAVYDWATGQFEEVATGLAAAEGPELLGEAGGRMLFAVLRLGVGLDLMSLGMDGSVRSVGLIGSGTTAVHPWVSARGRQMLYVVDYLTFEASVWETDGTAAGTRKVSGIEPRVMGGAWGLDSRVVYEDESGDLWSYDVLRGDRELLVVPREFGLTTMWVVADRGVFSRGDAIYETDGTAAGTRRIETPERSSSGYFVPVGTRVVYQAADGVFSVERSGGGLERLVDGADWVISRAGPAVVIQRGVATRVETLLSDGTAMGTARWMTRTGVYPRVSSLGDGDVAGFVQVWPGEGEEELYRTDGTVVGTERLPVTLPLDGVAVVDGALYFGIAPREVESPGVYMVGERGPVRRMADPRWTRVIGFGDSGHMGAGAGRAWLARRENDRSRSLWSVSGQVGDVVESPCSVCGGDWYVEWAEASRGMTALVMGGDGVRRLVATGNAGDEVETLWEISEAQASVVSGGGRVAAYDGRTVMVTDGSRAGTRVFDLAVGERELASVFWSGSWFAVASHGSDEFSRPIVRVWKVEESGVTALGTAEAYGWPTVFAGRLYWTKNDGEMLMTDGRAPLAPVGRGRVATIRGDWHGYGVAIERDSEGTMVKLVDPADVTFASMVDVARVGSWVRRAVGVGDRIVVEAGNSLGDLIALDPATGRQESLAFSAARVVGVTESDGREVAVVRESGDGREAYWVTDGTVAGTRVMPAGREVILRRGGARGAVVVEGRMIVIATVEDGPQVFAVNLCAGDHDGDGILDAADLAGYIGSFEAGDASADVNADGFTDFFDYVDFVAAFEAGC